jgi:phosphoenolpyruvate carboxykinase (GTP)
VCRFRKSSKNGKFLWPGFGDNIRVIDWILRRCDAGEELTDAVDSPIGLLPTKGAINLSGLDTTTEQMDELNHIDAHEWVAEVKKAREFFANFGDRLPVEITQQLDGLQNKLEAGLPKGTKL